MKKRIVSTLTALTLTLLSEARAGTPDQDWDALIPEQQASSAELDKALGAVWLGGMQGARPQIEQAIIHTQAVIDKE